MRLTYNKRSARKKIARLKKKVRIRKKVFGTEERPRLVVFRSAKHIYAQLVNDDIGKTIIEASTVTAKEASSMCGVDAAKTIGKEIAKKAQSKNISSVVFDRGGYLYHGRIKALADGAREAGLSF